MSSLSMVYFYYIVNVKILRNYNRKIKIFTTGIMKF